MADKYAKIENGTVTNIVMADADFAASQGLVLASADAEIGGTYDGSAFTRKPVVDNRTDDEKAEEIRSQRKSLIKATDWTQMPDSPLSDADKAVWQTYRQALRDVPSQATFPNSVVWPTKPNNAG